MKSLLTFVGLIWGGIACAQDVVIIGEVHDNPVHHQVQAEKVADLAPKALVLEMVDAEYAFGVGLPEFHDPGGLERYLGWDASGWPDFSMYEPIFRASPDVKVYGAHVSRAAARGSFADGIAAVFGQGAADYGLTTPLPATEQAAREALQAAAHCDALPENMLAPMVDIQRLRDAVLTHAVVRAFEDTGGPVAVITGNGHARRDWGIPAVLARVAPGLHVYVIGQTEDGQPLTGGFDEVISAPMIDRPDPCLAFQ